MTSKLSALECDLADVGFSDALQTIESTALSGHMVVGASTVAFSSGVAVDASSPTGNGINVLYELFQREEGRLTFHKGDVEGSPLGDAFVIQIEGCRLADEWSRHNNRLLRVEGPTELPDELAAALSKGLSVGNAVRTAGVMWSEVCDQVLAALESGALRVTGVSEAPIAGLPELAPDLDFDELVAIGRTALKKRRFDEALAAFNRALVLEPDHPIVSQNLRRTLAVRDRWMNS